MHCCALSCFNSSQFTVKEMKFLLEQRNRYRNFKTQNPLRNKTELLTGPLYQQQSEKTRQRIHPLGILALMGTGHHIQPATPWAHWVKIVPRAQSPHQPGALGGVTRMDAPGHQGIVIPPEQHAQGFGDTNTKPAHSETPPEAFPNTLLQPRVLIIPVKRREQLTRNHSVALNYDTLQTWQESLTG